MFKRGQSDLSKWFRSKERVCLPLERHTLYLPLAVTHTHTHTCFHHPDTVCLCLIFVCVCVCTRARACVIDSHHMRWSMVSASGRFALWAVSSARRWPASQALFFHPTIGFLSTTVTLTINNVQNYICNMLFNFLSKNRGAGMSDSANRTPQQYNAVIWCKLISVNAFWNDFFFL